MAWRPSQFLLESLDVRNNQRWFARGRGQSAIIDQLRPTKQFCCLCYYFFDRDRLSRGNINWALQFAIQQRGERGSGILHKQEISFLIARRALRPLVREQRTNY